MSSRHIQLVFSAIVCSLHYLLSTESTSKDLAMGGGQCFQLRKRGQILRYLPVFFARAFSWLSVFLPQLLHSLLLHLSRCAGPTVHVGSETYFGPNPRLGDREIVLRKWLQELSFKHCENAKGISLRIFQERPVLLNQDCMLRCNRSTPRRTSESQPPNIRTECKMSGNLLENSTSSPHC